MTPRLGATPVHLIILIIFAELSLRAVLLPEHTGTGLLTVKILSVHLAKYARVERDKRVAPATLGLRQATRHASYDPVTVLRVSDQIAVTELRNRRCVRLKCLWSTLRCGLYGLTPQTG